MIARAGFLLLCLLPFNAFADVLHPADISPQPVLAYGTVKLRSAYTGAALTACKTSCTVSQSIGFTGDNLDTTALDTFLGSTIGQVSIWNEQMGSGAANLVGTPTESPNIKDLAIGRARSLVFQGGSQSGALAWLQAVTTGLGITANTWTVMMVVRPSSSQYCNQGGAPGLSAGALVNFAKSGGPSVLEIYNNSQAAGDGSHTGPGGWQVSDATAFDFTSPDYMVPTMPQVLTITSGSHGVRVYVNEQARSTASRSALTDPVILMRIGALFASVAGANGRSFDGMLSAAMVWNTELSESDAATRRAALYNRFSIDPRTTGFNSYSVSIFGDSIAAGYIAFGLYGYSGYLPALLNHGAQTRMLSFSVPGSTLTNNPYAPFAYTSTMGLFPGVASTIPSSKLGRVVVIHGGGNDPLSGPGFRNGTSHGNAIITGLPTTADLTPGMYVYKSDIAVLSTILTVDSATQVTITPGTASSSITSTVIFGAVSPATVKAGVDSLTTSALAAGATGVVVSTILPRNDVYQNFIVAANTLIRGGGGYTLADCAAYPGLNTNPGPDYGDSGHMSALGNQHMAACLAPYINALMP
jgi:hypothetical protein